MERDAAARAWLEILLRVRADAGRYFEAEMEATRRRIEAVHRAPVTHDVEPAGAPRLRRSDD